MFEAKSALLRPGRAVTAIMVLAVVSAPAASFAASAPHANARPHSIGRPHTARWRAATNPTQLPGLVQCSTPPTFPRSDCRARP